MPAPTTDSHMYRTIHRQPADLRRLLAEGWEPAGRAAQKLAGAARIHVVGIGTSYHAALIGAWLLRGAGSDARAIHSFDFAHYPESYPVAGGDAVIVMAHSGVKQYSSTAMARAKQAGVPVISVGSLTAEHPDSDLVLRTVEREKSSAFTASHLAAMFVLAQLGTVLGEQRGARGTEGFRQVLGTFPEAVEAMLGREEEIRPVAEEGARRRIYAAAAGPSEVTAIEAVIKVREAAYGHIDGLGLEQFLHGPMVACNADDLALLVHVEGAGAARTAEVAAVLEAIGVRLWVVGTPIARLGAATVFAVPPAPELLSPLLTVVPMQLFAYHMAVVKGVNPDTFRRDDPKYRAAFDLLHL